jgi:hypothetical protein
MEVYDWENLGGVARGNEDVYHVEVGVPEQACARLGEEFLIGQDFEEVDDSFE